MVILFSTCENVLFVGLTCLVFLGLGRERAGLGQCVQPQRAPLFRWESVCVVLWCKSALSPRSAAWGLSCPSVWAALGDRGRAFTTWRFSEDRVLALARLSLALGLGPKN